MRPDQCPFCGSLDRHTALKEDGDRYDPFAEAAGLPAKFRCAECGKEFKFTFIQLREAV